MPNVLYEQDFVLWTQEQALALRAAAASGANFPVDWENVAEEIESLGRQQRSELHKRLGTIIEHLLKLLVSPARDPRGGWRMTIRRSRSEVAYLLAENGTLRRDVTALVAQAGPSAANLVAAELEEHGEEEAAREVRLHGGQFSEQETLDDWFPPD